MVCFSGSIFVRVENWRLLRAQVGWSKVHCPVFMGKKSHINGLPVPYCGYLGSNIQLRPLFDPKYSTAPTVHDLRFLQPEFAQVLMDEINPVITPEYLVVYDKCRHADYAGFLGLLPVVFQNFLFVRIV